MYNVFYYLCIIWCAVYGIRTGHDTDDGTLYFDEKHIDGSEYKGPLATTASVVRGATAFAAVVSEKLNVWLINSISYSSSLTE